MNDRVYSDSPCKCGHSYFEHDYYRMEYTERCEVSSCKCEKFDLDKEKN